MPRKTTHGGPSRLLCAHAYVQSPTRIVAATRCSSKRPPQSPVYASAFPRSFGIRKTTTSTSVLAVTLEIIAGIISRIYLTLEAFRLCLVDGQLLLLGQVVRESLIWLLPLRCRRRATGLHTPNGRSTALKCPISSQH